MLIDSHAHLQDKDLKKDVPGILERAREAGVERIVCVGWDLESSREAVELARLYSEVYAVVGVHPHDAKTLNDDVLAGLMHLCKDPKVVAVGEMGLDFYRDLSPRDIQRDVFRAQIKLAHEVHKPIVIHDRDAHQEVMDIIKKDKAGKNGGIMHCFSGHLPMAIDLMKEGFFISLAGPLTYKNAKKSHEVAMKMTLDRLMVETDCPYLTPEPLRGHRNEPANVRYVAEKISALRGKSMEEVAFATTRNTMTAYQMV